MPRRQILYQRGQRQRASLPTEKVLIPSYPHEPSPPPKVSFWRLVAPVGGVFLLSIGMGLLYKSFIYPLIITTVSLVYPLVMVMSQREQRKRWKEECDRVQEAYASRIDEIEKHLADLREQQAIYLRSTFPPPADIRGPANELAAPLWERRPHDPDFMELRLGVGVAKASYKIATPEVDIPELAPRLLLEANERASAYSTVPDVPLTFDLKQQSSLAIAGPRPLREALARSILAGVASLHAPSEVEIFAVYPANRAPEWDWLKWLPHTASLDPGSSIRHLAYEPGSIRHVLSAVMDDLQSRALDQSKDGRSADSRPFLLLFVADHDAVRGEASVRRLLDEGTTLGAGLILLTPSPRDVPEGCGGWVVLTNEEKAELFVRGGEGPNGFSPELTDLAVSEEISRLLAPIRLTESQAVEDLPDEIRLLDLIGCPQLENLDLEGRWQDAMCRPPTLQVPAGMRRGKRALIVDLKQSGHGPHGLIAGTTGSGKSELLLSLLTGLAVNHHPHQVNFILIDYKGGTAMSVLEPLPHTVGVVTDLDGRQTRRALIAMRSEMARREELLAKHRVADIDKFHELGISEPFPYLFLVIDEFAELKEHFRNDLADILQEFVSVAQKGRALGVHLLLAMQKPEGVVNDSIRANMKFRICFRVERSEDSRNVLGRPDAYLLPNNPPGRAYFQVGNNEVFDLFQAARVAGFHREQERRVKQQRPIVISEFTADGGRIPLLEVTQASDVGPERSSPLRTEAEIIVAKAKEVAQQMGIVRLPSPWPAPLSVGLSLDYLYELEPGGWDGTDWADVRMEASAPIGLLDEPAKQRQSPLVYEPWKDGNLLVVGSPGSGRTTLLLTLITSLARRQPPDSIHFHVIDFGGHQLRSALGGFPHVAGLYSPGELERIRRLFSALEGELETRRGLFADVGALSLSGYRRATKDSDGIPALFTVVNNLSGFHEAIGDDLLEWIRLFREGPAYGLYFALSSDRFPMSRVADLMQTRIALRLTDPTMYSLILGGRPDLSTFDPVPGRGYFASKPPIEMQTALPTSEVAEGQIPALQALGAAMSAAWKGPRPQPVRILEDHVSLAEVLPASALTNPPAMEGISTWIGLDETDLSPVAFDLERIGPYFMILGPPESGKTTALASIVLALGLMRSHFRLRAIIFSPRRGESYPLDALASIPHVVGLSKTERSFDKLLIRLENEVEAREQARDAAGSVKAHVLLAIDDYHLVANRVDPKLIDRLERLVRRGSDLGITTVLSLPTTVVNSLTDPVIRVVKSWRNGLWLRSTESAEAASLGVRIPIAMRNKPLPPGRGFLFSPSSQVFLQVASPESPSPKGQTSPTTIADWVGAIRRRRAG
jgi:S-DNA-T family DNA segregation ATPase FtsK/SpoIIIE